MGAGPVHLLPSRGGWPRAGRVVGRAEFWRIRLVNCSKGFRRATRWVRIEGAMSKKAPRCLCCRRFVWYRCRGGCWQRLFADAAWMLLWVLVKVLLWRWSQSRTGLGMLIWNLWQTSVRWGVLPQPLLRRFSLIRMHSITKNTCRSQGRVLFVLSLSLSSKTGSGWPDYVMSNLPTQPLKHVWPHPH